MDSTAVIVAAIGAIVAAIGVVPATLLAYAALRSSKANGVKADEIQGVVNGNHSKLKAELAEAMTQIAELNNRQSADLKSELAIATGRIATLQALWDKRFNGVVSTAPPVPVAVTASEVATAGHVAAVETKVDKVKGKIDAIKRKTDDL